MTLPPDRPRTSDVALMLFAVGMLIFGSPARALWANSGRNWLTPFGLWLLLLLVAAAAARTRKSDDS